MSSMNTGLIPSDLALAFRPLMMLVNGQTPSRCFVTSGITRLQWLQLQTQFLSAPSPDSTFSLRPSRATRRWDCSQAKHFVSSLRRNLHATEILQLCFIYRQHFSGLVPSSISCDTKIVIWNLTLFITKSGGCFPVCQRLWNFRWEFK